MRRDVPPQKISKLRVFPSQPADQVSSPRDIFKISKDREYVWTARGCSLEIFSCPQMHRVNYWGFPSLAKNPDVYISAVEELPKGASPGGYKFGRAPYLLVAIAGVNYLCLFDVCNALVLKCLQMPFPVTSLEVISHQGGACLQTLPLLPNLRLFFGLVAVGTEGGKLLLIDMCLDEKQGSNEQQPAQVREVSWHAPDLPQIREQALEYNEHLYFDLSERTMRHNSFLYKGSQNKTLGILTTDECIVTSLLYVPHATLLIVGFNFGCFQLWNLQDLSIVYASPLSSNPGAVVNFAFQEPENDPRNFCYLWVVYGQSLQVMDSESCVTTASMYSLSYDRKEWQEGFGFLYQKFNHCFLRFEHPLTLDPFNLANDTDVGGSRLISFGMIQDNHLTATRHHDIEDLQTDEWSNQDLSLCLMVWEAWEPHEPSGYFMLLFDINQWYQAQMPATVRRPDMNSFLGEFSLSEVMDNRNGPCDFTLKDVHVPFSSLHKFKTLLPADELYYPSSIAFGATCLTDCGVIEVKYLGTQRQLLWELKNLGPSYLQEPTEMFLHCCRAGLLSLSENASLNQKREALLSLALEYDLLPYLKECVLHSPTVDHSTGGFSLRFITDWAWKKISQIKSAIDRLYLPLFNCSGQELDQSSLALLYNNSAQLRILACLYRIMQLQATQTITQAGFEELSAQGEVAQLLSVYLQVILWLHQYCCLLPEHAEGEAYGENEVAYPASLLAQAYDQRRRSLHKLHSSVSPTDLLLIDGLMSKLNDNMPLHWERASCSDSNGSSQRLYPPPSLFAFLNIYLVNGVDIMDKHCLTLYLLLDMADFLSHKQSHLEERLMQFPAAFRMPPSKVKMVQGFWMLDRKDFAKATSFLTDPVVRAWDLSPMLHSRVLKSFLYQGQEKHALRYAHIRQPPLDTPEDIKLHLSLLLANRLIIEAYNFQRQRSDEDLLNHFFLGCQQTGNMCALLQLPLGGLEEQALIKFLSDSVHPSAKEMLILYLLQRNRPLEALAFTDKLIRKDDPRNLCNILVDQFIKILPPAQVHLAKELSKPFSRTYNGKVGVPLSSLSIRKAPLPEPVSKSTRLMAVKEALYNTWNKHSSDTQSPLRTRASGWTLNSMPFVGSPATEHFKKESELVYATPVGKRPSSGFLDNMESPRFPNKKSRGMEIISPMKKMNSERRDNRTINSEALLLLQTPPIKRQIPELRVCTPNQGRRQLIPVPPSILKMPQRSQATPTLTREELQPGNKYLDLNPGDLSETDMELQECVSTSPSEDVEFEEREALMEHSSLTRVVHSEVHSGKDSEADNSLKNKTISSSLSLSGTMDSPSFHKSDEIVLEDEDITLNFSMQKRREDTSSLGRSHLRTPGKVFDTFYKNLAEEIHSKKMDTSSSDTKSYQPPSLACGSTFQHVPSPHESASGSVSCREPGRNFNSFFKSFSDQMQVLESDVTKSTSVHIQPPPSVASYKTSTLSSTEIQENYSLLGPTLISHVEPSAVTCETLTTSASDLEPVPMSLGDEFVSTSGSSHLKSEDQVISLNPDNDLKLPASELVTDSCITPRQCVVYEDDLEMPSESIPEGISNITHAVDHTLKQEMISEYEQNIENQYSKTKFDHTPESDEKKIVFPGESVTETPILSMDQHERRPEMVCDLLDSPHKNEELHLELTSDEENEFKETGTINTCPNEAEVGQFENNLKIVAEAEEVILCSGSEQMDMEHVSQNRSFIGDNANDCKPQEDLTVKNREGMDQFDIASHLLNKSVQTVFDVSVSERKPVSEHHADVGLKANETGNFEVNLMDSMSDATSAAQPFSETGRFEVNLTDSTSDAISPVQCLQHSPDETIDSVFFDRTAEEKPSIKPLPKKPTVLTRVTRSRSKETPERGPPLPTLPEAYPISSSEQSPSSSVFTTPEKVSPLSTWNTRLRPRSESRTSSDSSPQTVREMDKRRVRTRQWSNTPSPQLVMNPPETSSNRKVTRSSKRGARQRKESETLKQPSSSIPEEPEDLATEVSTPKSALPFVFSPPATRSWTRRKKSDTPDRNSVQEKKQPIGIGLLSPEVVSARQERRDPNQSASSNWENYINLISPFTGKETKQRRSTVTSRSSTSSRHSMTLRTGVLKTRKVVKLK